MLHSGKNTNFWGAVWRVMFMLCCPFSGASKHVFPALSSLLCGYVRSVWCDLVPLSVCLASHSLSRSSKRVLWMLYNNSEAIKGCWQSSRVKLRRIFSQFMMLSLLRHLHLTGMPVLFFSYRVRNSNQFTVWTRISTSTTPDWHFLTIL